MTILTIEDGVVKLGDAEFPGILRSLSVSGYVRFDEQEVDNASGTVKTPLGFEDADIFMSFVLLTDEESDCYEKLEKASAIFREVDDKANPKVFSVANRHLLARGIRQVVFSRFQSSENDRMDEIHLSLGFVEHNPPIVKTEKEQAKSPTPTELAEQAENKAQAAPEEDSLIIELD